MYCAYKISILIVSCSYKISILIVFCTCTYDISIPDRLMYLQDFYTGRLLPGLIWDEEGCCDQALSSKVRESRRTSHLDSLGI